MRWHFVFAVAVSLAWSVWASTNVFEMPLIFPRHVQLQQQLKQSVRAGKIDEMEAASRAGVALMPNDPTWQYNLACALAYRAQKDEALAALDRAITLGFRDDAAIAADTDLQQLGKLPQFAALVAKAKRLKNTPVEGAVQVKPSTVFMGLPAEINASNTMWDFDRGGFITLLTLTNPELKRLSAYAPLYHGPAPECLSKWFAEDTASGNFGDLYVNRDGGHSPLTVTNFPGLTPVVYCAEAQLHHTHMGLPNTLFEQPLIGNSSMSMVNGPFWRSMPRAVVTDPYQPVEAFRYFINNQCWFYPSNKDFEPEAGDLYPANTPYYVVSQGTSYSDQPFMQAFAAAMAAFQPSTKAQLVATKLLAPTLQMILRATQKGVKTPADYVTAAAHPVVFEAAHLDVKAMVEMAHAMKPDEIPPLVALRTLVDLKAEAGIDYFDTRPEGLFDTPCCIARVVRGTASERHMTLEATTSSTAGGGAKFQWVLLQGDPKKVSIKALNDTASRVEISVAYHGVFRPLDAEGLPKALVSSRVDIGCFVKAGTYYSAPSFVSFFYLPNEERVYREDGQILSVDYTNAAHRYADPILTLQKGWKDLYDYDARGHLIGWYRTRGGQAERFTYMGHKVVSTDKLGRAVKACAVQYMPRQTGAQGMPPVMSCLDLPQLFTYAYADDSDKIGKASVERH